MDMHGTIFYLLFRLTTRITDRIPYKLSNYRKSFNKLTFVTESLTLIAFFF